MQEVRDGLCQAVDALMGCLSFHYAVVREALLPWATTSKSRMHALH